MIVCVQFEGDSSMEEFEWPLRLAAGRDIRYGTMLMTTASLRWLTFAPLPDCGGVALCCVCCLVVVFASACDV